MAGEALDRRNIWEPSVYYALGKETFYFAGHDISIRESIDTYGALIWPGVCFYSMACYCAVTDLFVIDVILCVIGSAGSSYVSVLRE